MKKKLSATLSALAACTLFAGLSGCSNSTSDTQNGNAIANATKPVTMTKAFNAEGIWYYAQKPSEDGEIANIIVFDGKGEMTVYDVSYPRESDLFESDPLTYADLEGLSDDEIISLAKDRDKKVFEVESEKNISDIKNYDDAEEFHNSYGMTPDEALEKLNNFTYQAPKSQSFSLNTGESEFDIAQFFRVKLTYPDFDWDSDTFGEYATGDGEFIFYDINVDVETEKVGNMYFDGYALPEKGGGFYMQVSKDFPGFILDKSRNEDGSTTYEN